MLEVNSECNLRCTFCNREELKDKGQREPKKISAEQLEEILQQFSQCPIDTIKLEGISEPMLHPDFDKCAKVLREKFPEAFIIIATNLQYNPETSPVLNTLQWVDMVYLSIDGVEEIYEKMRPGANYQRLLSSLQYLDSKISDVDRKKLFINFTATEHNYIQLPAIYQLKDQFNLAGVRINLAQNWSEEQQNSWDFNPSLKKFLQEYQNDLKGVPDWRYHNCFWPFEGIIIDVNGNIRQCIINTSQRPIGNIYRDDIRKLYNESRHYQQTREMLAQGKPTDNCLNCDYQHLAPTLKDIFGDQAYSIKPRPFKESTR